jgi:hypothetical protein
VKLTPPSISELNQLADVIRSPSTLNFSETYDAEKRRPGQVDLSNNVAAKIKNPLEGIPQETLLGQVDRFAAEHGMTEVLPLLRTGALVAQNPHDFENIEMDEADREELRGEQIHRWRHTRTLYMTIILCSIGAAVQ